eukprot:1376218-Prymnesium_polylepis.1
MPIDVLRSRPICGARTAARHNLEPTIELHQSQGKGAAQGMGRTGASHLQGFRLKSAPQTRFTAESTLGNKQTRFRPVGGLGYDRAK